MAISFERVSYLYSMKAINVDKTRAEIIKSIQKVDDEALLKMIYDMLKKHSPSTDFWDELNESQQAHILKGREDIANGRTKPWSEIRKKYAR
jgi:hypothetical protein